MPVVTALVEGTKNTLSGIGTFVKGAFSFKGIAGFLTGVTIAGFLFWWFQTR